MKKHDNMHGFTVTRVSRVEEINATSVNMLHEKSGARLVFLDREDSNKTFAIGFKTVPTNDTGVFHILEHSVLCGSRKFPVKDPFTELLKGSVTTFLNAMTYGEKTVYPVSSKNDKAFHGLVDVYLDAVLHPLALENPYIFMQEGHRYTIDDDGRLGINGVVYNEMKGAYSSADEYADYLINNLSTPGGTYSYDSGGNPDVIPSLTYEDFKAAHKKFYHPSNAVIFLDGSIDLDDTLALIDSYLNNYDRCEIHVPITDGTSPITEPKTAPYPIEKEDDSCDKSRIYLAYNTHQHKERCKSAALALAAEAIADSNNAPLTKKILDTGLCESFSFYPTRSYYTNALNVKFVGVKDGKEDELIAAYDKAVSEILEQGVPMDSVSAALSRTEFTTRESDFGTYPKGMVYMAACMEAVFFDEEAESGLRYNSLFDFLHSKLDTDYYTDLLKEVISLPRATLILHPDKDFSDKKDAELKRHLEETSSKMSDEEKSALREQNEAFDSWQDTPDSEDALATIPHLCIEDLNTELDRVPTEIYTVDGVSVISHPITTLGISYPELYFEMSDIPVEDIPYLRVFSEMLSEWNTTKRSVGEFRNQIKKHLGVLFSHTEAVKNKDEIKLYTVVKLSCLESKKRAAIELLREFLYKTVFENPELVRQNIKQMYTASVEYATARGDSLATKRDAAKHSLYDAAGEKLYGYTYHAFIKSLSERIDSDADDVIIKLEEIRNKYFTRERLTLAITDDNVGDFAESLINTVPKGGTKCAPSRLTTLPKINEGIAIPSPVSYAARTTNLSYVGENAYTGAFATLSNVLTYELLWNEIRLKGGAYDTGFNVRGNSGTVSSYSYRDPSANRTVEVLGKIPELLDDFLNTSPDLLKYIIGTVGATDIVSTPRASGSTATTLYLAGRSYDDVARIRKESIDVTNDTLRKLKEMLDVAFLKSTFTVVGPRDALEAIPNIDKILDI